MTKEITIKRYDIAKPEQVKNMAVVLSNYINKNGLSIDIQGKKYCQVEGWEFAGFLTGVMPFVASEENLSSTTEIKWKANVELRKGEHVIGRGTGLCSDKETDKRGKKWPNEYAVLSMAQTRAIGKAYRNIFGWVMKLAGYEATPVEEIKADMPVDKMFEKAKVMILACKSSASLITMDEKIQGSKKYSAEQKATLHSIISQQVDKLDK